MCNLHNAKLIRLLLDYDLCASRMNGVFGNGALCLGRLVTLQGMLHKTTIMLASELHEIHHCVDAVDSILRAPGAAGCGPTLVTVTTSKCCYLSLLQPIHQSQQSHCQLLLRIVFPDACGHHFCIITAQACASALITTLLPIKPWQQDHWPHWVHQPCSPATSAPQRSFSYCSGVLKSGSL